MSLIKSISGIRGTVGGEAGKNLSSLDIIKFSAAYGLFIKQTYQGLKGKIIIGRDGRISGKMINKLLSGILLSQGFDVLDLDLASTPTVEMAVIQNQAQGGIIITASHNPQGWNALKFLNNKGEFLSAVEGQQILDLAQNSDLDSVSEEDLGKYTLDTDYFKKHLEAILSLNLVTRELIAAQNLKIVVDGINSVGGIIVPELLQALGVKNIIKLNCEPNGLFAHAPEPLDKNLKVIKALVISEKADLGIVVDPDVDRLAFIDEQGKMFGEEYTLVAVADYILKNYKKSSAYKKLTVSNLSSSRALRELTKIYHGEYQSSAVGEVNVVNKMKESRAIIGGEGNGGIIYPELHYGRDALVGIALFLSSLVKSKKTMSSLKKEFPKYFMVKDRLNLSPNLDVKKLLKNIKKDYSQEELTTIDGLKIDWLDSWVHLRASNTEAILRIYAEASSLKLAKKRVLEIKNKVLKFIK